MKPTAVSNNNNNNHHYIYIYIKKDVVVRLYNNIHECICAKTLVINKQMFLLFILLLTSKDRQFIVIKERTDIFIYNLIIKINRNVCYFGRNCQLISLFSLN
jgi:hypothetical protein